MKGWYYALKMAYNYMNKVSIPLPPKPIETNQNGNDDARKNIKQLTCMK